MAQDAVRGYISFKVLETKLVAPWDISINTSTNLKRWQKPSSHIHLLSVISPSLFRLILPRISLFRVWVNLMLNLKKKQLNPVTFEWPLLHVYSVFPHVASIYANLWEQKKQKQKSSIPTGLSWYTNMAAVFWTTKMATVTSCENTLNWQGQSVIKMVQAPQMTSSFSSFPYFKFESRTILKQSSIV